MPVSLLSIVVYWATNVFVSGRKFERRNITYSNVSNHLDFDADFRGFHFFFVTSQQSLLAEASKDVQYFFSLFWNAK